MNSAENINLENKHKSSVVKSPTPVGVNTEDSVIGILLMLAKTPDSLLPDMFLDYSNRNIFRAIKHFSDNGEAINPYSISLFLKEKTDSDEWTAKINTIIESAPPIENKDFFCNLLVKRFNQKNTKDLIDNLLTSVKTQKLDQITKTYNNLVSSPYTFSAAKTLSFSGEVDNTYIDLKNEISSNQFIPGVPSGIDRLDEELTGFRKTDLIVLAARPAVGKTSVAINMLLSANCPAGFISTEQPTPQLIKRMLSIESGISSTKIRNPRLLSEFDLKKIEQTMSIIKEKSLFVNDNCSITISELKNQVTLWKNKHDIGIVFIDYLQRIDVDAVHTNLPKHEKVSIIAKELKNLARTANIPVVALAQINREVQSRGTTRPTMENIKGSGDIEQEADIIITLFKHQEPEGNQLVKMELNIEKNRHGPCPLVSCFWDADKMKLLSD